MHDCGHAAARGRREPGARVPRAYRLGHAHSPVLAPRAAAIPAPYLHQPDCLNAAEQERAEELLRQRGMAGPREAAGRARAGASLARRAGSRGGRSAATCHARRGRAQCHARLEGIQSASQSPRALGSFCLPRFVYIGVGHGGSTTLMDRLAAHPQVAPNVVGLHKPWRETWYLSLAWPLVGPDEGAGNGEGGRSGGAVDPGAMPASVVSAARVGYATLFQRGLREAGGVLVSGEKTPSYWRFRGTATRLAAVALVQKLLMLLRDRGMDQEPVGTGEGIGWRGFHARIQRGSG